jgi:hypothetical protein
MIEPLSVCDAVPEGRPSELLPTGRFLPQPEANITLQIAAADKARAMVFFIIKNPFRISKYIRGKIAAQQKFFRGEVFLCMEIKRTQLSLRSGNRLILVIG